MADKLKLSTEGTERAEFLSTRLGMRRNVICRIALGIAIATESDIEYDMDQNGQEFNKSTIMGTDEAVFLAMIAEKTGKIINPDDAFNTIIREYILKGLALMSVKYKELNSPTDFLSHIAKNN